jgi:hypothetical protein
MGTWAVDPFGNDDACDWAYGLPDAIDLSVIDRTLSKVISDAAGGEIESSGAAEGVAAAEVVARLLGIFGERNSYTQDVDKWVAQMKIVPDTNLVKKAKAVIEKVLSESSELLEVWGDSYDFEAWKASVLDIKSRLSA